MSRSRLGWYAAASLAGLGALCLPLLLLGQRIGWLLLVVGLIGLVGAVLPGFTWAGSVPLVIGVGALAAAAVSSSVGPTVAAVEAMLVMSYLVLLDLAESGAGRGGLRPQLGVLAVAVGVLAAVLAAAGLPPLPWLWLGLLAMVVAVATYRLALGAHLPGVPSNHDPETAVRSLRSHEPLTRREGHNLGSGYR